MINEKLSVGVKLAYGAGDFGPAIVGALKAFFLLFFLTDVARLSPVAAGSILLIGKIWDAVNDPLIGWLSDRTKSGWGRRRPWILYGAIPFGLLFFLLWLTPPLSETGKFVYYLAMAMLGDIAFTVVNLPYAALTPELTRDYDERTSLNSYRFAFSVAGALLAAVLHPVIVNQYADVRMGYMISAAIWSVIVIIPCFIVVAGTRERPESLGADSNIEQPKALPYLQQVKLAFANRPYRFVIGLYLLSWLVLQLVATVIIYYMTYFMQRADQIPLVMLAIQGSTLIFLFVWSRVSRRLDKRQVYMMGATIWLLTHIMLYFLTPEMDYLMIPMGVLAGVGLATAYLIPWAMMPDVIEFDEWETGQRREGIFYGFMVFLQKACLAIGIYMVGVGLDWAGYITPTDAVPVPMQPENALWAMRLFMGPIPALILAGSLVVAYFYPITREKHAAVRAALAERKERINPIKM